MKITFGILGLLGLIALTTIAGVSLDHALLSTQQMRNYVGEIYFSLGILFSAVAGFLGAFLFID